MSELNALQAICDVRGHENSLDLGTNVETRRRDNDDSDSPHARIQDPAVASHQERATLALMRPHR